MILLGNGCTQNRQERKKEKKKKKRANELRLRSYVFTVVVTVCARIGCDYYYYEYYYYTMVCIITSNRHIESALLQIHLFIVWCGRRIMMNNTCVIASSVQTTFSIFASLFPSIIPGIIILIVIVIIHRRERRDSTMRTPSQSYHT